MMINNIFEEERTGNYTKWNSGESVGFTVIVVFFSFDIFYSQKSGNISVLLRNPTCKKDFSISATIPILEVLKRDNRAYMSSRINGSRFRHSFKLLVLFFFFTESS